MTPRSKDLFIGRHDLLRQRRLERGLPAEQAPWPSARRLLALGGGLGSGLLALVLFSWVLISLRSRVVTAEIARLSTVPAELQALEGQLRSEKGAFDQLTKRNEALAGGLVAVSSGSALLQQLAELTPQGVQITEATVSGQALALKGRADEPDPFTRVNAFSLLLAYAPMFKPDVRVIKLSREAPPSDPKTAPAAKMGWDIGVNLASLKQAQQLSLLRQLGADGMAKRLQDLSRMGVMP
jgi:type IV pilus assembly protein PilN